MMRFSQESESDEGSDEGWPDGWMVGWPDGWMVGWLGAMSAERQRSRRNELGSHEQRYVA